MTDESLPFSTIIGHTAFHLRFQPQHLIICDIMTYGRFLKQYVSIRYFLIFLFWKICACVKVVQICGAYVEAFEAQLSHNSALRGIIGSTLSPANMQAYFIKLDLDSILNVQYAHKVFRCGVFFWKTNCGKNDEL